MVPGPLALPLASLLLHTALHTALGAEEGWSGITTCPVLGHRWASHGEKTAGSIIPRNVTTLPECLGHAIDEGVRFRSVHVNHRVSPGTAGTTFEFAMEAPQPECPSFGQGTVTPTFVIAAEKHLGNVERLQNLLAALHRAGMEMDAVVIVSYDHVLEKLPSSLQGLVECFPNHREFEKLRGFPALSPLNPKRDRYAYFNGVTHLAVVAEVAKQGLPGALILEDDAILSRSGVKLAKAAPKLGLNAAIHGVLRNDSGIVVLGGCWGIHPNVARGFRLVACRQIDQASARGRATPERVGLASLEAWRVPSYSAKATRCAHAYLVTSRAAQAWLMRQPRLLHAIDWHMNAMHAMHVMHTDFVEPALFCHPFDKRKRGKERC